MKSANDNQHDQSMHDPASPDSSDNEMEKTFLMFTPDAEMVTANPLYGSAGLTEQGGAKVASNLLYESAGPAGMGGAGAVVNPLYESTYSLTGVGGGQAATNLGYEPTPNEEQMRGEENYGAASDDEGGGSEKL